MKANDRYEEIEIDRFRKKEKIDETKGRNLKTDIDHLMKTEKY
jgi:hypothetical protein